MSYMDAHPMYSAMGASGAGAHTPALAQEWGRQARGEKFCAPPPASTDLNAVFDKSAFRVTRSAFTRSGNAVVPRGVTHYRNRVVTSYDGFATSRHSTSAS